MVIISKPKAPRNPIPKIAQQLKLCLSAFRTGPPVPILTNFKYHEIAFWSCGTMTLVCQTIFALWLFVFEWPMLKLTFPLHVYSIWTISVFLTFLFVWCISIVLFTFCLDLSIKFCSSLACFLAFFFRNIHINCWS